MGMADYLTLSGGSFKYWGEKISHDGRSRGKNAAWEKTSERVEATSLAIGGEKRKDEEG